MIVELLDNGCVVWGPWGAGVLRGGRGQPFRGVHGALHSRSPSTSILISEDSLQKLGIPVA
jgi:hypothetical protein